jgi:hypothetical protein
VEKSVSSSRMALIMSWGLGIEVRGLGFGGSCYGLVLNTSPRP